MESSRFMERVRVIFRFAPAAIDSIEGVNDLLDLDEAIAEALENPRDDPEGEHVMGTSEAWDEGFIFADVDSKDPQAVVRLARPWLEQNGILDAVVIAYYPHDGPLTVLHPPDFQGPFDSPL